MNASYLPVRTDDGSFTLAHPVHGETCHSRAGAWEEARLRYASACRLRERAQTASLHTEGSLALLDVGTGLGLNLAAALEAVRGTDCRLEVLTLELEPRVIEASFELFERERTTLSPELASCWEPTLAALRSALAAPGEPIAWEAGSLVLLLGDARETLPRHAAASLPRCAAATFDAVFLDAFSPRVEPELWSPAFLREIAARMRRGSLLSTYSASMSVRAGLLAAGLAIGPGARVGTKASGTLASPDLELASLPPRLVRRLHARALALGGNSPAAGDFGTLDGLD